MKPTVPLYSQSGLELFRLTLEEAHRLIRVQHAEGISSKRRLRHVRLTVPLAVATGQASKEENAGTALSAHLYMGTKYTAREHIAQRFYISQHKKIAKGTEPLFDAVCGGCIVPFHDGAAPKPGLNRGSVVTIGRKPIGPKRTDLPFGVAA